MIKHTLTAAALAVVLASPGYAQDVKPDTSAKPDTTQTAPMNKPDSMNKSDTMNKSDAMNKPMSGDKSAVSPASTDSTTFVQSQNPADWRGSKLIGATVYGPDNASIGDINDVLIGSDGKINAVVLGVGGFLGVGEKNVAVPFSKLTVNRKPDSAAIEKVTVAFTKDELKNAPQFAYFEPASRTTTTGTGTGMSDRTKAPAPTGSPSRY